MGSSNQVLNADLVVVRYRNRHLQMLLYKLGKSVNGFRATQNDGAIASCLMIAGKQKANSFNLETQIDCVLLKGG